MLFFSNTFSVFPLFFFGASSYMKTRSLDTAPQTADGTVWFVCVSIFFLFHFGEFFLQCFQVHLRFIFSSIFSSTISRLLLISLNVFFSSATRVFIAGSLGRGWVFCSFIYFSFAVACMHLDIVMVSEVSQTEKDKCHMISLLCGI